MTRRGKQYGKGVRAKRRGSIDRRKVAIYGSLAILLFCAVVSIVPSFLSKFNLGKGGAPAGLSTTGPLYEDVLLTAYGADPSKYASGREAEIEGGSKTKFGEKLHAMEQFVEQGIPVSIAGKRSLATNKDRPLLMITAPGIDNYYPNLRSNHPYLPKDTFIGRVEDTGASSFFPEDAAASPKYKNHLDIAVVSRTVYTQFSARGSWQEIKDPFEGKEDISTRRTKSVCYLLSLPATVPVCKVSACHPVKPALKRGLMGSNFVNIYLIF